MIERVLPFAGIHNFRDYGGYATQGGGQLRSGMLFRSGQHLDATPEDLGAVIGLNLRTVIDLRGNFERENYPCRRHPEFGAAVLYADGETTGHAPHVEAGKGVENAADAHRAMELLYQDMPFRERLIEVFQMYFNTLATRDGGHLIHCLAGKDRTGLGVALLHDMLGVHPDDIMADYLLTNSAGNIERRIAAGAAPVRNSFGANMDDGAVRTLMSVAPEYLEAAFASIRARHGSIDRYRTDVLGITDTQRQLIEARLVS